MNELRFRVTRASEGLKYGDGKISAEAIPFEIRQKVDETIEANPNILVLVDFDDDGYQINDDGCGDGRGVGRVFKGLKQLKRSLHRAKVFGGALAMTAGIWIGQGRANGLSLEQVFTNAVDELEDSEKVDLNYGAHTADHVAAGRESIDSGCGAIDAAPLIVPAAVRYESSIRDTLKGLNIHSEATDRVFDNYRSYAETIPRQPEYSGKRVMNRIMQAEKVVKELQGPHLECRIILNDVEGYTVNQELIREVSGGQAQVFAVDVWRLRQIAEAHAPHDKSAQEEALVSELVYTLGVAGVLTPGDLPVYIISGDRQPVAA